jgi:hypothetical protein
MGLAMAIYNCMTKHDPDGVTGAGISTTESNVENDIHILLSYGNGGKAGIGEAEYSYTNFIREYGEERDV